MIYDKYRGKIPVLNVLKHLRVICPCPQSSKQPPFKEFSTHILYYFQSLTVQIHMQLTVNQALVLRSNCVSEKMGVNKKRRKSERYSHTK
jgi:hypothetical protein